MNGFAVQPAPSARQRRPLWGCSSVARAPALQAGGRGLKPRHFHQFWGRSSVGRAPRWQRGGRRIVPARLHQKLMGEKSEGPTCSTTRPQAGNHGEPGCDSGMANASLAPDFGPNGQWVIYHTLVMKRRVKPPRPQVSLNPCIPRQSLPDILCKQKARSRSSGPQAERPTRITARRPDKTVSCDSLRRCQRS